MLAANAVGYGQITKSEQGWLGVWQWSSPLLRQSDGPTHGPGWFGSAPQLLAAYRTYGNCRCYLSARMSNALTGPPILPFSARAG